MQHNVFECLCMVGRVPIVWIAFVDNKNNRNLINSLFRTGEESIFGFDAYTIIQTIKLGNSEQLFVLLFGKMPYIRIDKANKAAECVRRLCENGRRKLFTSLVSWTHEYTI